MTQSAILIAGPTASGKSAVAMALAERLSGVIINADSMQVYRELPILTARPSAEDEALVPHRLYGVLGADEVCSVGRWLDMAKEALEECESLKRRPIFVGGTGLYFQALLEGLTPIPDIPEDVRLAARARHEAWGGERFREALKELDPEAAARLPAGDTQRLIRAWEVVEATGRPLSAWQEEASSPPLVLDPAVKLVIAPEREVLYARCNERFDVMMREGAREEVAALTAQGLGADLPAMRALGVPFLMAALEGHLSPQEAEIKAKTATRRYAKRQMTWLRGHMMSWKWYSEQYSESLMVKIFSFIREKGLT